MGYKFPQTSSLDRQVIYRHSFTHCDCVVVGDPCLSAKFEGKHGEMTMPVRGRYTIHLDDSDGMVLEGVGIEEFELVKETPILGSIDFISLPENVMPNKCTKCDKELDAEDKLLLAIFAKDLRMALCRDCYNTNEEENKPSIQIDGEPLSEYLKRIQK